MRGAVVVANTRQWGLSQRSRYSTPPEMACDLIAQFAERTLIQDVAPAAKAQTNDAAKLPPAALVPPVTGTRAIATTATNAPQKAAAVAILPC